MVCPVSRVHFVDRGFARKPSHIHLSLWSSFWGPPQSSRGAADRTKTDVNCSKRSCIPARVIRQREIEQTLAAEDMAASVAKGRSGQCQGYTSPSFFACRTSCARSWTFSFLISEDICFFAVTSAR